MSRATKILLTVTVMQLVNAVLYTGYTARNPSALNIGIVAFAFVGFAIVFYVLLTHVKKDGRVEGLADLANRKSNREFKC